MTVTVTTLSPRRKAAAREPARALLSMPDRPTAIFASNDLSGIAILQVAAELGIRVPEDLSVIGFDDLEGSANFYPPLTTVRQDLRSLGAAALGSLIEAIAGGATTPRLLAPELLVRASTAAPRT